MALVKQENWQELNPEIFKFFMEGSPLLLAGDLGDCNVMTVGWGQLGSMWSQPVCTVYVRPTRHTFGFLEKKDYFSLSLLPSAMQQEINYCGTVSGRDEDKIKACGFQLETGLGDTPFIAQAQLVLICKKLYWHDIDPSRFLEEKIADFYELKDYHRVYLGRVEEVWQSK